jgi:hypothetical protein
VDKRAHGRHHGVKFSTNPQRDMNKKGKILTVVALAVFGAIILFHYGSIDYERKHNYDYVEEVGDTDWIIQHHGKILWRAPFLERSTFWAGKKVEVVHVEWPGHFYLGDGPITDVRLPVFVLAVFYVGLFSILASHERTRTS